MAGDCGTPDVDDIQVNERRRPSKTNGKRQQQKAKRDIAKKALELKTFA
jgi:hypothetical protein